MHHSSLHERWLHSFLLLTPLCCAHHRHPTACNPLSSSSNSLRMLLKHGCSHLLPALIAAFDSNTGDIGMLLRMTQQQRCFCLAASGSLLRQRGCNEAQHLCLRF